MNLPTQRRTPDTLPGDLDRCDVAAYHECVKKVFESLDISWDVVEPRLVAVTSDGASVMESYCDFLNAKRKEGSEKIVWVRDAAHMLMRAIATAKKECGLWYKALDGTVATLAAFYRTSSKRMRGLHRNGGKRCFSRRTKVRWVEAMAKELDTVLENLDAVLAHLPEYIEEGIAPPTTQGVLGGFLNPEGYPRTTHQTPLLPP